MCDNIEATQSCQSLLFSTTNTRDLGGFPISEIFHLHLSALR